MLYNVPCHTPERQLQDIKNRKKLEEKPSGASLMRVTKRESFVERSTQKDSIKKQMTACPVPHVKFTYQQNFTVDGQPICLFCAKTFATTVPHSESQTTSRGSSKSVVQNDNRFCSYDCQLKYQVRTNGSAVRRQLFELEHGRCVLCKFDAHSFFQRLKALRTYERRRAIEESPIRSLSWTQKEALIRKPTEGALWQADHAIPVAEGGGECSLENYRTLCTPCHARETSKLNHRLKLRAGKGSRDIRQFFQKK